MRIKAVLLIMALWLAGCSGIKSLIDFENENEVIFYSTYAYQDNDEWVIPLRIYVHQRRERVERLAASAASLRYDLDDDEKEIFRSRADDFVADGEWREKVVFKFKEDPHQHTYQIKNRDGKPLRTDLDGLKEGSIRISKERADSLLVFQGSDDNWLNIKAVSDFHTGEGRIQLVEPYGLSVISDIDDTIKITELPGGNDVVIRNTFFKEFTPAPGMSDMYNEWDQATFHYVSGAPWQLYKPISAFLFTREEPYPAGSFHMKTVRKNLLNPGTWRDLSQLITNGNMTYEQKLEQIIAIINTFPDRQFILIGDSGEKDPEMYSTVKSMYPDQIQEIIIRDIVNDREKNPERLAGMTIIAAETVGLAQSDLD